MRGVGEHTIAVAGQVVKEDPAVAVNGGEMEVEDGAKYLEDSIIITPDNDRLPAAAAKSLVPDTGPDFTGDPVGHGRVKFVFIGIEIVIQQLLNPGA